MINSYDSTRFYNIHKNNIDKILLNIVNNGNFINGQEVSELENKLCKYIGSKYCISCANGTDALYISLLALNIEINDEIITTPFSWISTVEVICLIKAIPIFVDINENDFSIDIEKLEQKITNKTKAIIIPSLFGQTGDIDKLNNLNKKYNLPIIEDSAQSFGSKFNNLNSLNLTTIGTTSFFPTKILGCYGDGGAIFTNDSILAYKIKAIKNHGAIIRFNHDFIGLNSRLDTIQAGILLHKFDYLNQQIEKRRDIANYYSSKLEYLEELKLIKLPKQLENRYHVWSHYSIIINNQEYRDKLIDLYKTNNINIPIFYPKVLYKNKCFEYLNINYSCPIAESICNRIINLPIYPEIYNDEIDLIIKYFIEFFQKLY